MNNLLLVVFSLLTILVAVGEIGRPDLFDDCGLAGMGIYLMKTEHEIRHEDDDDE